MTYLEVAKYARLQAEQHDLLPADKRAEVIDAEVSRKFPEAPDAWVRTAVDAVIDDET